MTFPYWFINIKQKQMLHQRPKANKASKRPAWFWISKTAIDSVFPKKEKKKMQLVCLLTCTRAQFLTHTQSLNRFD